LTDRNYPELSLEDLGALNYDHSGSIEISLLVEPLDKLRAGQGIEELPYDFSANESG
jgi:uridine kinase